MFVNITRGKHTQVIECREVTHFPCEDKVDTTVLQVERMDGTVITHEIPLDDKVGVYLMNDQGSTIDSWFRGM